jgi:glutamate-1-semialdehyde 2,1-aminomutase
MAAGIATLAQLTGPRYSELEVRAESLESGLRAAATEAGRAVSIARVGSLLTVFFRPTPPLNAAEALAADRGAFARFFGAMLDRGILLPPSPFEAWFVSMAHGSAALETTLDAARKAFRA